MLSQDLRAEVLRAPASEFEDAFHGPSYYHLVRAMLFEDQGQTAEARAHYDSVRVMMEEHLATGGRPLLTQMRLAFAYAALGRFEEAIGLAEPAAEQYRNALFKWLFRRWLAEIYVMAGRSEAAIDILESLLQEPALITVPFLRAHPAWDPLRGRPRFQALLERHQEAA